MALLSPLMLDVPKMKKLRAKLGLTQAQAASAAGFGSKQAWNNIESGRQTNVTLQTLEAVAKVLKCKPRDLLTE